MNLVRKTLSAVCLFAFIFSCASKENPADSTELTETPLTLWHAYRGAEAKALQSVVSSWNQSEAGKSSPVRLEANPDDGFSDKLSTAIPNGNGPDLFIFAHDRIGGWAKSGLLFPLQDFVSSDSQLIDSLFSETLLPLQFQEQLYALPLSYKSAVLFYHTDLIKEAPKTTDELIELAKNLRDNEQNRYGLVYPHSLLFFHSSWLFGFGGSLFSNGKANIDTPENARSLAFVKSMIDQEILPKEVDGADTAKLFNAKQAAMVINGPWFRGDIDESISYAVAPLPVISETQKPSAPFLTVEGVLISDKSLYKKEAYTFARYLVLEGAETRLKLGKQSVASKSAYELPEAKEDPILQVFLKQLHASTPTPNIPEMSAIWTPFDQALKAVMQGRETPETALKQSQIKIP